MNKIIIQVPYDREFLKAVLQEFEWDFESRIGERPPVMTGNCSESYHLPHAEGDLHSGYYLNAAACCNHCYPSSNPACLRWNEKKDFIRLECEIPVGTKPIRFFKVFYKIMKNSISDLVFTDRVEIEVKDMNEIW